MGWLTVLGASLSGLTILARLQGWFNWKRAAISGLVSGSTWAAGYLAQDFAWMIGAALVVFLILFLRWKNKQKRSKN